MKLYAMSCGRIRCRKSVFVPDADKSELIESPMPVFLITHPQGNLVFDTGPHPDVFADAASRWGGLAKAFEPLGDAASGIVPQLEKAGVSPDDIRFVLNSHLHFDHAGGNEFFPRATFLVSRRELDWAKNPQSEGKGYFRSDWDHPLAYREIEGELDVYGDGRLTAIPMPGHTVGHQVLLVRLAEEGNIILSGDCVPCRENLLEEKLPRNNADNAEALRSIQRLREIAERERAMVIHGHDPVQWQGLKLAPDCYS